MDEENMSYYYSPKTEEDFIRIAEDVYGSGVKDNTPEQLVLLGQIHHHCGNEEVA